ncbi:cell division control protein 14, SIN component-domain-containing protein [Mycena vulgaris]|nr:cell division control protein 14, SIN component-domain-containing protein [Mycena vulgaris]
MESRIQGLKISLEDALDDLSSPRTSSESKTQALRTLERILASACVPKGSTDELDYFLALQYTFECNVPSRLLSWIASYTLRLDLLTNQGVSDADEVATLSAQLALALSIIQGVCLTHAASKRYLGRRHALEVLLDLFLAARQLSSPPSVPGAPASTPLASIVLDTLLCVLVDAPGALRIFEACHGVHSIVRILKRAATPREVRMKCLEFLYFYLLDETAPAKPQSTPAPTAPSTPIQPSRKPFINATPARPISRYGSSTFSLTSSSFASSSSSSSRSTSDSSVRSFSSTSSNASSAPSTAGTSPTKETQFVPPSPTKRRTASPTKQRGTSPTKQAQIGTPTPRPQPRALLMLRRDVDFVPLSPKKVMEDERAPLGKVRGRSKLGSDWEDEGRGEDAQCAGEDAQCAGENARGGGETRTTEEKKLLLGTMLGNVEALVEGVRKAGVWGLG